MKKPEERISLENIEKHRWYIDDDVPTEDEILEFAEELRI